MIFYMAGRVKILHGSGRNLPEPDKSRRAAPDIFRFFTDKAKYSRRREIIKPRIKLEYCYMNHHISYIKYEIMRKMI